MAEADQPDIVCLGEPMAEFSELPDGPPGHYLAGFGGDTSNCAIAAARQGARVGYLTALGDDSFGDAFIDLWRREGVDCRHVRRDPDAHTAVYFISHGADGHRFSYLRRGSAASRITSKYIPEAYIAGARVLHISGISQAISDSACDAVFHAIDIARRHDTKVSYDLNLRLSLWPLARARAITEATAALADFVLTNGEEGAALTGRDNPDDIAGHYLALAPSIVVVKTGADGALVATAHTRETIPGHTVKTVDASGAGDTFDGAFLAETLRGADPIAAARYANAAAALSTTGYGAVTPIPDRAIVKNFLGDT
jgi:2-dehydro-3-deoxygluconokinase